MVYNNLKITIISVKIAADTIILSNAIKYVVKKRCGPRTDG